MTTQEMFKVWEKQCLKDGYQPIAVIIRTEDSVGTLSCYPHKDMQKIIKFLLSNDPIEEVELD